MPISDKQKFKALEQAFEQMHATKQQTGCWNGLKREKLAMKIFQDPAAVIQGIKDNNAPNRNGWPSENTKSNYYKFVSNLLKATTLEQKRTLLGILKKDRVSKGEIEEQFVEKIHSHFMQESHKNLQTYKEDQIMSKEDYDNFVSIGDQKRVSRERLAKVTPENVIKHQFDVAHAMMLFCSKIRRNDIATVKFNNISDQDNVTLDEDSTTMRIKKANKTGEENVKVKFAPYIVTYIKMLRDARASKGQDYLLMQTMQFDLKTGKKRENLEPNSHWFGQCLTRHMKSLFDGKALTDKRIRIAWGIKLSESDNGDYQYQLYIEKFMGHTYAVHQQYYNMFKSFEQRLNRIQPDEEGVDPEVAIDSDDE